MADKFGAAMALVKSDIGGNIAVGFCHPFLSYIFLFWYTWIACMIVDLYVIMFSCVMMTCYDYMVLP